MYRVYSCLLVLLLSFVSCTQGDSRRPLVVIGIDGAEWDVIDKMISEGELPHFERLKKEGSWGHLVNFGPLSSPVVWTTYATGRFARDHGIMDFLFPYEESERHVPVDSSFREAPSLWEIASRDGRSVHVFGYFVTQPATPLNGMMVSDRVTQSVQNSVYPEEAFPDLEDRVEFYTRGEGRDQIHERFFAWEYDPEHAQDPDHPYSAATQLIHPAVDRILYRDALIREITMQALDRGQPDLLITYFRGPDVTGHSLWKYFDPTDFEEKPSPFEREHLGQIVPESYRWVDEAIGMILARLEPESNIILISDHGFGSATGSYEPRRDRGREISGNHRPDGIFLASGPDFKGGKIDDLLWMDLYPTIAYLAGLPISSLVPGEVRLEPFVDSLIQSREVEFIPEYEPRQVAYDDVEARAMADRETLQTLQGLGYIGEVDLEEGLPQIEYDFWQIKPRLLAGQVCGQIIFYLVQDRPEKAHEIFAELLRERPDLENFMLRQLEQRAETIEVYAPNGSRYSAPLHSFLNEVRR